jgi:hypothetical protein
VSYFVGIDLGLVSEPTAIVVVESNTRRFLRLDERQVGDMISVDPVFLLPDARETTKHPPVSYALRHIERLEGGTGYPQIARRLKKLTQELPEPQLVVDVTGVGKAVMDLLHKQGLSPTSVTITAGGETAEEMGAYRMPKRELVSLAQVILQTERLKIARTVPHADVLVRELQSFRVRQGPGNPPDSYLDWRESENDDLVFALALALWSAERSCGGIPSGFAYGAPGPYDGPRIEW